MNSKGYVINSRFRIDLKERILKIIQLIQKPQLRGAEIFACQLSSHLTEMGHEVMIVTIFRGDADLPYEGNIHHLERSARMRFFDPTGWRKFYKIIQKFKPHIVQANASDTLKFAVSSKLLNSWKQPIVYRNANKMGDFINTKSQWHLNKFYISKVSYVISVSKECEKDFKHCFNFPVNKIQTIEIGVEKQKLGAIPSDLTKIFEKGPIIVHIGGFVPEKNHLGLIRIFPDILKHFPRTQLLLLGKGRLQGNIRIEVNKLGINRNVHFLDYRKDVLNILANSDAFVLPSFIEGLPAVILEAMYCKTPVIAYNVGGVGEVVMRDKTGWPVEKNNIDHFKASLIEVLQRGKAELSEINTAKEMITSKFLNQKIAERFLNCYNDILGN